MKLLLKRIDSTLPLPVYAHDGDAGLDLYSAQAMIIDPGQRVLIPTGIALAIPEGFAGFVLPRSGRAITHGLSLVNSPGLIDSHYRGEIKVIAINHDQRTPIAIARGDKVAQLVIQRIERCDLCEVEELDVTARGEGGFGSTGS